MLLQCWYVNDIFLLIFGQLMIHSVLNSVFWIKYLSILLKHVSHKKNIKYLKYQ